ncbi:MAG: hypothetical protein ACOYJY_00020 [Acutalibacteraceae bacterium]|jgi:hypothetical protein
MEDIIKRIIEVDRQARRTTEAAQREKLDSEREINEKVQALRERYLQQARRRIEINGEMDRTIIDQKWEKIRAHYDAQEQAMEQAFAAHRDEWVRALVERTLAR